MRHLKRHHCRKARIYVNGAVDAELMPVGGLLFSVEVHGSPTGVWSVALFNGQDATAECIAAVNNDSPVQHHLVFHRKELEHGLFFSARAEHPFEVTVVHLEHPQKIADHAARVAQELREERIRRGEEDP